MEAKVSAKCCQRLILCGRFWFKAVEDPGFSFRIRCANHDFENLFVDFCSSLFHARFPLGLCIEITDQQQGTNGPTVHEPLDQDNSLASLRKINRSRPSRPFMPNGTNPALSSKLPD